MEARFAVATSSILALLILAVTRAALAADDSRAFVRTDAGPVQGVVGADVVSFKGIPYAAPPVGELRWRPPQAPPSWESVRRADRYGAICMQPIDSSRTAQVPQPSEDCLTLNVWTANTRAGPALPVMVWIHGGSFTSGSGAAPVYDGTSLARRNVVVVTLNYRLGRFGFFAHPALTAERREGPLANYALMDMMAALRWVARNIASFGGDPANVTVFGESSGAAAVNRLMIMPAARGLFHRAISQSGNGREFTPRLQERNPDGLVSAEENGRAFAVALGLADASAAQLRALPAELILNAGTRTAIEGGPVLDGALLTMEVAEAFEKGLQAPVPFLVGSTSLELPVQPSAFEQRFASIVHVSDADRRAIRVAYVDEDDFRNHVLSDLIFREPARFLAAAHARRGLPSFLYRFDVVATSVRGTYAGAPHASELAYLFGTLDSLRWEADATDRMRAAEMSQYWTNFARHGDPNSGSRPAWPRYSPNEDALLDFTNVGPQARKTPAVGPLDAIAATYTKP